MGIFSLVGKTAGLAKDLADIAVAPVEVAVDLTSQAVEPLKDLTEEIVEEFED